MFQGRFWLLLLTLAATLVAVATAAYAWQALDGDGSAISSQTHAIVAAGLALTVVLLALLLGSGLGWRLTRAPRLLPTALAAVGILAVGSIIVSAIVYGAALSRDGASEAVAVSQDLSNDIGVALASAPQSEATYRQDVHDVGSHPTLEQFQAMSDAEIIASAPAGTLTPEEVSILRQQLRQVRVVAERYFDVNQAIADGYVNTTHDVPFMGAHFLNPRYVADGTFDPSKPEGLLYSKAGGGEWKLVGVWFLIVPGINPGVTLTTPPQGFAGNLDLWHEHERLCVRAVSLRTTANTPPEVCAAEGGRFIGDVRWMMHAWVVPENIDNPEGVFAYLNGKLFREQTGRSFFRQSLSAIDK